MITRITRSIRRGRIRQFRPGKHRQASEAAERFIFYLTISLHARNFRISNLLDSFAVSMSLRSLARPIHGDASISPYPNVSESRTDRRDDCAEQRAQYIPNKRRIGNDVNGGKLRRIDHVRARARDAGIDQGQKYRFSR